VHYRKAALFAEIEALAAERPVTQDPGKPLPHATRPAAPEVKR
jgi:hypothetical protein